MTRVNVAASLSPGIHPFARPRLSRQAKTTLENVMWGHGGIDTVLRAAGRISKPQERQAFLRQFVEVIDDLKMPQGPLNSLQIQETMEAFKALVPHEATLRELAKLPPSSTSSVFVTKNTPNPSIAEIQQRVADAAKQLKLAVKTQDVNVQVISARVLSIQVEANLTQNQIARLGLAIARALPEGSQAFALQNRYFFPGALP